MCFFVVGWWRCCGFFFLIVCLVICMFGGFVFFLDFVFGDFFFCLCGLRVCFVGALGGLDCFVGGLLC